MTETPAPQPYTGEPEKPAVEPELTQEQKAEKARQGLPPTVQVEFANEPMQLKKADPKAKGPWIQYNGVGTVRTMGPKEWKSVGVDCDDYHEWSYMNKKRLPRSVFSDAQLQYLLRVDGRFSLVEDKKTK